MQPTLRGALTCFTVGSQLQDATNLAPVEMAVLSDLPDTLLSGSSQLSLSTPECGQPTPTRLPDCTALAPILERLSGQDLARMCLVHSSWNKWIKQNEEQLFVQSAQRELWALKTKHEFQRELVCPVTEWKNRKSAGLLLRPRELYAGLALHALLRQAQWVRDEMKVIKEFVDRGYQAQLQQLCQSSERGTRPFSTRLLLDCVNLHFVIHDYMSREFSSMRWDAFSDKVAAAMAEYEQQYRQHYHASKRLTSALTELSDAVRNARLGHAVSIRMLTWPHPEVDTSNAAMRKLVKAVQDALPELSALVHQLVTVSGPKASQVLMQAAAALQKKAPRRVLKMQRDLPGYRPGGHKALKRSWWEVVRGRDFD